MKYELKQVIIDHCADDRNLNEDSIREVLDALGVEYTYDERRHVLYRSQPRVIDITINNNVDVETLVTIDGALQMLSEILAEEVKSLNENQVKAIIHTINAITEDLINGNCDLDTLVVEEDLEEIPEDINRVLVDTQLSPKWLLTQLPY